MYTFLQENKQCKLISFLLHIKCVPLAPCVFYVSRFKTYQRNATCSLSIRLLVHSTAHFSGFAASGKLHIGDLDKFHYSYSPTLDNTNNLTLQRLSVRAEKEFYEDLDSAVRPIPSYEAFADYYGEFDAADRWIQAAFAGSRVVLGEKEFDFANLDVEGRTGELQRQVKRWLMTLYIFSFIHVHVVHI